MVGNSNGKVWIQEPDQEPHPDDFQLQAFLGDVKWLIVNSASTAFAADAGGAVRFIDFDNESVNEIRHYSGVGKLIRLVSATPYGQFWSLCSESEKGDVFSSLELWNKSQKEKVHYDRTIVEDFDADLEEKTICKVLKGEIETHQFESGKWNSIGHRPGKALFVKFMGKNGEFIAVIDQDSAWLEIWNKSGPLNTVAYARIPGIATCLATHENRILIGCESGKIISYTLEGEEYHAAL